MNSVEITFYDLAAIAVNLAVAYFVILKSPQPVTLLIPILAATSVVTGIIQNRLKPTDSSVALTDVRIILNHISFVGYIAILLMRFNILEALGFTIVTGLLTGIFFLITNLTLNNLRRE
jgi:hypothetical protein